MLDAQSVLKAARTVREADLNADSQIREELLHKLPSLLEDGGYIPQLDHLAPPDISYSNWLYYLECKQKLLTGDTRL